MSFKTGFHQVVKVLQQINAPYLVGGSFASAHHGVPRATNDADILVDLQPRHVVQFAAGLRPDFYVDEAETAQCVRTRRSFNLIHMPTVYKYDMFLASTAFHHTQLDRAIEATFDFMGEPITCRMSSAEDIVLAKLDWYRIGGKTSDRQWNDIANVISVSGDRLDPVYLRTWAAKLGVGDLLEKALDQPDV